MGDVLYLKSNHRQKRLAARSVKCAIAERMILTAAEILSRLDEREKRIGWLLEDCADLLRKAGQGQNIENSFDPEKDILN